jgi:hypothetical protein
MAERVTPFGASENGAGRAEGNQKALARLHSGRSLNRSHAFTAGGTLTPRIFGNRESDQRRESVKSFANALIDALQRIAVALERIAERMK